MSETTQNTEFGKADWARVLFFLAYVFAGFWTYGHMFNQRWCGKIEIHGGGAVATMYRHCASPVGGGIFWPLYWTGRLAIYLTAPEPSHDRP